MSCMGYISENSDWTASMGSFVVAAHTRMHTLVELTGNQSGRLAVQMFLTCLVLQIYPRNTVGRVYMLSAAETLEMVYLHSLNLRSS